MCNQGRTAGAVLRVRNVDFHASSPPLVSTRSSSLLRCRATEASVPSMHSSDATPPLDESDFIALTKVLQEPATPPPPLVRPASPMALSTVGSCTKASHVGNGVGDGLF